MKRRRDFGPYLYIAPAAVMFLVFVGVPAIQTFYYAFWDWNGLTPGTWAGLDNFASLFTDPLLKDAVWHSMVLLVFFAFIPVALALLVTGLVGRRGRRGLAIYRTAYFMPQVISLVAIGVMWRWMYSTTGPIDQVLGVFGLSGPKQGWLGNFFTALPALGLVGSWLLYGVCVTLFLSGVQKIDTELYDAAAMDGAGSVWAFRAVTLPALRREIALGLTITGIAALASFDIVYVATLGGPGDRTTVPGLLVYRLGFTNGQIGAASALAIALTALMAVYVLIINRINPKD